MKKIIIIITILGSIKLTFSQNVIWKALDNSIEKRIEIDLINRGYEKMHYYYDNTTDTEGHWILFGWAEIGIKDYILVNTLKIPNNKNEYNFLIIYSKTDKKVIAISKPLFDSWPNQIKLKKDNNHYSLKIKITYPCEENPEEYYLNF